MRIAINGFTRKARYACIKKIFDSNDSIIAINDAANPTTLVDLLKLDISDKKFNDVIGEYIPSITADNKTHTITIDARTIKILNIQDPKSYPWKQLDIDMVYDCCHPYGGPKAIIQEHISAGAKNAIMISGI